MTFLGESVIMRFTEVNFMPEAISSGNFDQEVLKAPLPVLVDFWAPWCGPCRMVSPIVEAIEKKFENKLKTVKVNTDENQELASQFKITGIPTLIVFKGGKEVDRIVGYVPQEALASQVVKHLS